MSRQAMSAEERHLRSRLSQQFYDKPLLRGSLGVRKITCGDPHCRCARGQTHDTLYLTYVRGSRKHQVSIPHELESWVRRCVQNYQDSVAMLDELCEVSHEVIKAHKMPRR